MVYITLAVLLIYVLPFAAQASSPEVDVAVLQRLRNLIDQQRDQIRLKDRELNTKSTEIENVRTRVLNNERYHISGWELTVVLYNFIFLICQYPPTRVICLPENNSFGQCFTHSQFKLTDLW